MNRELIDYIGSLLFRNGGGHKVLQLKSEKQFHVRPDGTLEKEQSILTNIRVGGDAIYFTYQLPDGNKATFVSAVTDVECEVDSNYTIGCIVYKTAPGLQLAAKPVEEHALFTLFCDDDKLIFFGEKENAAGAPAEKTYFEISGVA